MIRFECPKCWAVLKVKNKRRAVRCPTCGAVTEPEELDDAQAEAESGYQKPLRASPYVRAWNRALWVVFGCAALASGVLLSIALAAPKQYQIPLWYGVALFFLAALMFLLVSGVEENMNPEQTHPFAVAMGATGGVSGVLVYFVLRYSFFWPHPLFILFLGIGTVVGAVALDRRPAGPDGKPLADTGPNTGPLADPVVPFVKPKTPPPATAFPGLVAYWAFDEGTGAKSSDSVSKAAGTLNGGKWVAGVRGNAIEFNGTSDSFFPGPGPGLDVGANDPFTFALWVRPKEANGIVLGFRSSPDGLALLRVWMEGGKIHAGARHNKGVLAPHGVKSATAPVPGEWHHVAFCRDAGGNLELFVDGVSVDRAPPGREATGAITTNSRSLGQDVLEIKNRSVKPFGGAIDEFCAFNRALTATEIAKLAGRDP